MCAVRLKRGHAFECLRLGNHGEESPIAKLEPFLGFLHALKDSNASLVCDFMEPYRYLIDDLLIERCQKYRKKDFVAVTDFMMNLRMGKKIHLCEYETDNLADALNDVFNRVLLFREFAMDSNKCLIH